jgi:pyruvate formate lyase activating enzyme
MTYQTYRRLSIIPIRDLSGGSAEADLAEADEIDPTVGYMHSYEITGAENGPGIRFMLFLAGCPLRCQFCHNPDTWFMRNGRKVTVDRMVEEIGKYARFVKTAKGGLTISGGEPMLQYRFLEQLVARVKSDLGLHIALDTSGYLGDRATEDFLADIDLVLLDIKSIRPELYKVITSVDLEPTLRFARRLSDMRKPAWIRFVLVPGLSDDPDNVEQLADYVATLQNVERLEVLPFHQLGTGKWEDLGIDYQLKDSPTPSNEQVAAVQEVFRRRGVPVY